MPLRSTGTDGAGLMPCGSGRAPAGAVVPAAGAGAGAGFSPGFCSSGFSPGFGAGLSAGFSAGFSVDAGAGAVNSSSS